MCPIPNACACAMLGWLMPRCPAAPPPPGRKPAPPLACISRQLRPRLRLVPCRIPACSLVLLIVKTIWGCCSALSPLQGMDSCHAGCPGLVERSVATGSRGEAAGRTSGQGALEMKCDAEGRVDASYNSEEQHRWDTQMTSLCSVLPCPQGGRPTFASSQCLAPNPFLPQLFCWRQ